MTTPLTTDRLPFRPYDTLPEDAKPLADYILGISSAGLAGPYNALLRSPKMAKPCLELLDYLRFHSSISKRLTEFAILIQARVGNAPFEWWAHERIGRREGLDDRIIKPLWEAYRPTVMDAEESLVFEVCAHLSLEQRISDVLWGRALGHFGESALIDLVSTSGVYSMVSMLLNAVEVSVPEGAEVLPKLEHSLIRKRMLGKD
ncbi:MAG: carboxymuconolactone decarboxylase family protein [Betaproteobacteria bacterium]|nr:carboxymuconolactone decarboxylase family protein [Betaproteobacteria bacterium]